MLIYFKLLVYLFIVYSFLVFDDLELESTCERKFLVINLF